MSTSVPGAPRLISLLLMVVVVAVVVLIGRRGGCCRCCALSAYSPDFVHKLAMAHREVVLLPGTRVRVNFLRARVALWAPSFVADFLWRRFFRVTWPQATASDGSPRCLCIEARLPSRGESASSSSCLPLSGKLEEGP